jgi:hypothetical protein
MGDTLRAWRFQRLSEWSLSAIARRLNPIVRGWINYREILPRYLEAVHVAIGSSDREMGA